MPGVPVRPHNGHCVSVQLDMLGILISGSHLGAKKSRISQRGVLKTKTFDLWWPPRCQVSLCALRMATLSMLSLLRVAFLLVGRYHQCLKSTKLKGLSQMCVGGVNSSLPEVVVAF